MNDQDRNNNQGNGQQGGDHKPMNQGKPAYRGGSNAGKAPYHAKSGDSYHKKPYAPRDGQPGERRPFDGPRKPYAPRDGQPGERRSFDGPRKPYAPRDGQPAERRPFDGPRKPYAPRDGQPGERRSFDGPRKPYAPRDGQPAERRPFDGPRKPYAPRDGQPAERRSFDSPRKPYAPRDGQPAERRPFDGPRKPYAPRDGQPGERRSFDGPRKAYAPRDGQPAERRPFNGPRKPYAPRDGQPAEHRSFDGSRKPYAPRDGQPVERRPFDGPRKPYAPRDGQPAERRPFDGPRKPYAPRDGQPAERRPFDGPRKPYAPRDGQPAERRPFNGPRKPFPPRQPYADRKVTAVPFDPTHPHPEARPVSDGQAARRLAYEVLLEVADKDAYASLALDRALSHAPASLDERDRRLASSLVYDTIENQIRLDWVLSHYMQKEDSDVKLRVILRLGACQLLMYDKIPESAAVNTAVQMCKNVGMEGLAGACNAILRSVAREKETLIYPSAEEEPMKHLSILWSMPMWLVEKLCADYGLETATQIIAFRNRDKGVTIRPNLTKLDDAGLVKLMEAKGWTFETGTAAHSFVVHGAADVARDPDCILGRYSIMGVSSMMAAQAVSPRAGMQVLDACAAPGGKSCLMAEMMDGTGRVQSWDLHEHRVKLIEAQARRLGLDNVRPMTRDATTVREDLIQTMDALLLDAPCSGTGVITDKPDVKYRLTAESLAELTATQAKMLDTCCQYVKKGGVMVYSTCAILPEENEKQIETFLAAHPEFKVEALPETIPESIRAQYGPHGVQLLPCRDGVEGFYIVRMRRNRV